MTGFVLRIFLGFQVPEGPGMLSDTFFAYSSFSFDTSGKKTNGGRYYHRVDTDTDDPDIETDGI